MYTLSLIHIFYEEGVDGNNVLKAGTHTAVISYLGKSAEVELTVVDKAGEDQGTLNVDTPVHKEESQENMESIKHSYAFLPVSYTHLDVYKRQENMTIWKGTIIENRHR